MATAQPVNEMNASEPVRLEEVLRSARETAGLSGRRLAERVGMHHAGLARIELGQQRPSPETLSRLAQALELDETDLFALAGYRLPDSLPSFPAYLRAKYRMPKEAATQLNEYFSFLAEKYDIETDEGLDDSRPSD
jgi:transcriptional regulator with XRE-family HTH domain